MDEILEAMETLPKLTMLTQLPSVQGDLTMLYGIGNTEDNEIVFVESADNGDTWKESPVRIWAGATHEDRSKAPFRVHQNGGLYAVNAYIEGTIIAKNGVFTGTVYATDGVFNGTVYASDGVFTGTVNATSGSFTGDVNANNFKSTGTYSHKIVSHNLSDLGSQIIGNFPYSVYRITPQSNNQQLLVGRGGASHEGKVIHIHNTHASYNIELINGDYLSGALGKYTIQPRGTIQLMWSQDSNDWIILSYIQTPSSWRA